MGTTAFPCLSAVLMSPFQTLRFSGCLVPSSTHRLWEPAQATPRNCPRLRVWPVLRCTRGIEVSRCRASARNPGERCPASLRRPLQRPRPAPAQLSASPAGLAWLPSRGWARVRHRADELMGFLLVSAPDRWFETPPASVCAESDRRARPSAVLLPQLRPEL